MLVLNFSAFIAGYLVKSKLILSTKEKNCLPEVITGNVKSSGHIAIIYFRHGETENYNPVAWLNQCREFDEQKIKFVPFIVRTFFVKSLRKKYLIAWKSNHRAEHHRMMEDLGNLIRDDGDFKTRLYIAFPDDHPGVKEAVINALNDGAKRIIILNVFLTVSSQTVCGYDLIKSLECEKKYGFQVDFTEPLWNSEFLQQSFVEKVNENIGKTEKEKVAVALIGYGQPKEWDITFPTQTEQEIIFREKIIEKLIGNGFKPENLGMAWMEFKKPGIHDLLKKFNYNDIEKLFYFAAAISANALISQVIIPEEIQKFTFPKHLQLINAGAWNSHPLVIKAIKEKADNVMRKKTLQRITLYLTLSAIIFEKYVNEIILQID